MLSQQEVARLLDAAPGLKYKAALSVAYGAGLRARACHAAAQLAEIDKRVSLLIPGQVRSTICVCMATAINARGRIAR